jgi:renalase
MSRVAIVGAGAAGSAVAYALEDDAEATIFEKDRDVSGRGATRRRHGCTYDYGANYIHSDEGQVSDIVAEMDDGLVDVTQPVWTFDGDGAVSEGRESGGHKWSYTGGIDQFAERLLSTVDAVVLRETTVDRISREPDGWIVTDATGHEYGEFDALVLTPPAPLTADLLGGARWAHSNRRRLRERIERIPYRVVTTVVLNYPVELEVPYYALVNTDNDHDVGWLSRESCKDGHVPDGESLLVVQMAPDWSIDHYGDGDETLAETAADKVATLLEDDRLADPEWFDVHRFRYALPDDGLDEESSDRAADHDLYFAGDWVAGEGRVHLAAQTGLETGERVLEALEES